MAGSLAPFPIMLGAAFSGCKMFAYAAGTSTKQDTYTSSTLATPNSNPVVLDSTGYASVWVAPSLAYKFVLAPSTDTDPPASPIWTVDNSQLRVSTRYAASVDSYTNTSTGETNGYSTTVAANELFYNGDALRVQFVFTTAANGNTKTVKMYFGANYWTIYTGTGSGLTASADLLIIKNSTNARLQGTMLASGPILSTFATDIAATFSAANTLKITLQGGASSDVTHYGVVVTTAR
jgi:hypothetical protein